MYCSNCGSMMDERQQFCPFCKAPNPVMRQKPQFHGQVPPPPYFYNNIPQYYFDPANQPPEIALVVISALIPLVGLIIGCICLSNNEKRAGRAYLIAAGVRFGVTLLLVLISIYVPLMLAAFL